MQKLIFTPTPLSEAYLVHSKSFEDERGSFSRVFCIEEFFDIFKGNIAQINHSVTLTKGSLRGMHFQYPPHAEAKMVKCIKGSVYDVIVDIRQNSPTFLQWFGTTLSANNQSMIYIPEGFAHGFQTLEDHTELLYLHSKVYTPEYEGALNSFDETLNINWPLPISNISEKDRAHPMIQKDFKGVIV
jgi:dTDP-4-dehydrorhamnose 3,5-epimerase